LAPKFLTFILELEKNSTWVNLTQGISFNQTATWRIIGAPQTYVFDYPLYTFNGSDFTFEALPHTLVILPQSDIQIAGTLILLSPTTPSDPDSK